MHKPVDTKEKLLDTAIDLVCQSSYGNVGVNEICEQAGVTKGSFYHYFDSKAALFHAASEHAWEKMKGDLNAIFSPEHSALTQLEMWIDFIVEKQKQHQHPDNPVTGCPFFTAGAQCAEEEAQVRETALEMADRSIRYSTALVRGLQAEGCLEQPIEPQHLGRIMCSYVQGLLLYGRVVKDLDVVIADLREGIYRIVALKPELRRKSNGKAAKAPAHKNSKALAHAE